MAISWATKNVYRHGDVFHLVRGPFHNKDHVWRSIVPWYVHPGPEPCQSTCQNGMRVAALLLCSMTARTTSNPPLPNSEQLHVVPEPTMVHIWGGVYVPPDESAELQEVTEEGCGRGRLLGEGSRWSGSEGVIGHLATPAVFAESPMLKWIWTLLRSVAPGPDPSSRYATNSTPRHLEQIEDTKHMVSHRFAEALVAAKVWLCWRAIHIAL